jgi:curved DNA-binding protein CbpA
MSHELICTWLGLEPGDWPPDHYRLLGLEPGESDAARIEQQVHDRLEAVRRYQLLHPELVTEAMNRLAQAYVCLTDPDARRAYDAGRPGRPGANGARPPAAEPAPVPATPVPVIALPAPVPAPEPPAPPAPVAVPAIAEPAPPTVEPEIPVVLPAIVADALPATPPPAPPQSRPKADPVLEASRSTAARRGLGTRRALYRRLAQTRRLMRAWERAGRYLANPKRRLSKPAEATELIGHLKAVREALEGFPALLGEAGQPGYSVVVLARQPVPVPIFQTLLPSQRETLAQHWKSGHQLLQAHRNYLRLEIQALRKRGRLGRALRAARHAITDQPGILLLLLALIALNIAIWRQYFDFEWGRIVTPKAPATHR